jgi:predicted metal-binding membrane protein
LARTQFRIFSALLIVIFAAWGYLYYQYWQMAMQPMTAIWMPPSSLYAWKVIDFFLIFIMWAVMMAAMMLPSAIPMTLAFSRVCRQRQSKVYSPTLVFVLAYLCAWFGFSALLTLLQWQMHGSGWLTPMMENNNLLLASVILFLAGFYQFQPLKNSCLKFCRSPLGFLLNEWHEGYKGAFTMGLKHGATCVGCCWAQMLIMFVVGVMNLLGMAFIALIVSMEKLTPVNSDIISKISGFVFILWGLYFLYLSFPGSIQPN